MADETGTAERSARRPAPAHPTRSRPILPRAATGGLAVLGLVVAALCLHSAGADPLGGIGPLHDEWLLVALVCVVGGWYLGAKYHARQNERPMGTPGEGRLITLTRVTLILTIMGTFVALVLLGTKKSANSTAPPPPLPPEPRSSAPTAWAPPPDLHQAQAKPRPFPLGELLLVLGGLAFAAALVALVVVVLRWLSTRVAPAPELTASLAAPDESTALSAAVSAGRLALHGEDVRAAVIACYAAMEDSLGASGVGRQAADSPADLLRRATEAGLLAGTAPQELAELFREARYSSHPMADAELRRARAALDAISAGLAEHRASAQAGTQAGTQADARAGTGTAAAGADAAAPEEVTRP